MRAALGLALAMLCAGCISDFFAAPDLPPPRPRPVYAMEQQAAAAPAAAVQPASARRDSARITTSNIEDFACRDGGRLRLTYGADRRSATARMDGGAPIRLARADEDGLTAYAGEGMVFRRSGPRASLSRASLTAGAQGGDGGRVRVEAGDTLGSIAHRLYGDRRRAYDIAQANADQVPNPDLIFPGQVLRLPGEPRTREAMQTCRIIASLPDEAVR